MVERNDGETFPGSDKAAALLIGLTLLTNMFGLSTLAAEPSLRVTYAA